MNATARFMRRLPHVIVAIFAVVLLIAIVLAHRFSPTQVSHLADVFVHTLHGPGFAGVAVLVFAVLRLYRNAPVNYLHAAAAAMAIGVFAEAAQIPGPRDAEAMDLVIDALGIVGGLGVIALCDRNARASLNERPLLGLSVISIAALLIATTPMALYGYAWISQYRAMPTLLSFENRWESAVFSQPGREHPDLIAAPSNWLGTGTIAYAEEAGRRGTLIRLTPYPDWGGYSTVSFIAASGNDDVQKIAVSVRDIRLKGERRNNRYSQQLHIGPEPKRYVISLDKVREIANERPFDIAHIESFSLNAADPGGGAKLLFDDFRLE
jgi:hypothetical protein